MSVGTSTQFQALSTVLIGYILSISCTCYLSELRFMVFFHFLLNGIWPLFLLKEEGREEV